MKTYITYIKGKKINRGKKYLFAYDSIFIARGNTVQKTRSFGAIDTLTNVAAKKRDFELYLQQEEARLRISHWKEKVKNPDFLKYVSIEKIENFRSVLFRAKKDMGDIAVEAMEQAFLIDFIYNSNKLEGSKVPRESIEKHMRQEKKLSKNAEVRNSLRALYDVSEKTFRLHPLNIQKLHDILLEHEPENIGFRKGKVVVGNTDVCPWEKIKEELRSLCAWYEKAKKDMYPIELAFDFYYKFERIHPFMDGNGRTGRLLMNWILKSNKYHPIIIWNRRQQAHMHAFQKRMEGKVEYFYKFMAEQFVKTHGIYLKKINDAVDYETLTKRFLEPSEYNN